MAEEDILVERLRKDDDLLSRHEAADRIEELEAALKRLIHWCDERDVLRDESARAKAALADTEKPEHG